MIFHLQNELKQAWLPPQSACQLACALQLAQFYEPVISPFAGNDASHKERLLSKYLFAFRFDRHMTIQPTEGATWGPQFHHVSIVRFKHKPLALGTRTEAGKCYIYNVWVCTQDNFTTPSYIVSLSFSEQTCTRSLDGLPWIMLMWRLTGAKRSTDEYGIY